VEATTTIHTPNCTVAHAATTPREVVSSPFLAEAVGHGTNRAQSKDSCRGRSMITQRVDHREVRDYRITGEQCAGAGDIGGVLKIRSLNAIDQLNSS
jgi:hypothetical protein